jgi:hypothetical protein
MRNAGKLGAWTSIVPALSLLIVLLAALPVASPRPSRAAAEESGWVGVSLLYHSDVKGHIEPCG